MGPTGGPHFEGGAGAQLHRHVILDRVDELGPPTGKRVGLRRGVSVTQAALEAGHVPEIQHVGKRFKIVCACGWSTTSNMTRKKAFEEAGIHTLRAGRTALGHDLGADAVPPVEIRRVEQSPVGPSL